MKRRLNFFLLGIIALTAAVVGYGVWALSRDAFTQLLDQRIAQTQQELLNKFHSFDLFMREVEGEMDARLSGLTEELAARIAEKKNPADWTRPELNALAARFKVGDIYLIDAGLTIFQTTFPPDQGLNLGSLSDDLKRRLGGLLGSGRTEVDRMSMSNKTGIIKKYVYHGPKGADHLVETSVDMWKGAETFGSEAQKRFFLEEFFQSLVDANDILLDLDLFIADELAQWSILKEGVPLAPEIAKRLEATDRLEIREGDRLTVYVLLPRSQGISGFRYYGKTVFDTGLPVSLTRDMALRALLLAFLAALAAFVLAERTVYRWLLTRLGTIDRGVQRIGAGDYDAPIHVAGADELSRIGAAVDEMRLKITSREEMLQNAKKELEGRVAERTRELTASLDTLAESETAYRYLVEHAQSIILRWKPDGTITFFSDYAQTFFGYREEEILGRTIFETIVPRVESEGRDLHLRMREIAAAPIGFAYHENENRRRDGSIAWVAWANHALTDQEGELEEILSVGTDITHLKRVQEELTHARDAAETANRAKSAFLAAMSHEIRTPMTAIIGMADLLAETRLTTVQQQYVNAFRNAGDTLISLINDILDLSKIEADRLDLERVEVDLEEIAGDLADMMTARVREKGLVMTVRVDPAMTPVRLGDPARLRQILVNLVGNAIKFTDKGKIGLSITEPTPGRVCFEVEDQGIGIPEEKREAIFGAFSQADAGVTRKFGGTGLGLAICKRLVHLMGGAIGLTSEVGLGSTFFFTIPMPPTGHRRRNREELGLPGGLTVLLAGGGAAFPVVRDLLESIPVTVVMHPGLEDLAKAAAETPQPRMLVIDGGDDLPEPALEAARAVRQALSAATLPIAALIPEPDHTAFLEVRALDAACLAKPVRRRELLATLGAVWLEEAEESPAPDEAVEEAPSRRPLEILLAEDSSEVVVVLSTYLRNEPHRLVVAENGKEALARMAETSFDLVLMDVQMPELDGLSATREIRRREREAGDDAPPVPVIALTANAMKSDEQKSLEAGCDDHLTKPIRKKTLLEVIDRYALEPG